VKYHFVITVQRPAGGGFELASAHGTGEFAPGMTRAAVFEWAWDQVCEARGWPKRAGSVLFFDLAPNALS